MPAKNRILHCDGPENKFGFSGRDDSEFCVFILRFFNPFVGKYCDLHASTQRKKYVPNVT